jgi:hypothetical protein
MTLIRLQLSLTTNPWKAGAGLAAAADGFR